MPTLTLTQAATAAGQFLGILDSGETLSTQQLNDALAAANNLLENWYQEQKLAMTVLITEQAKQGTLMANQQAKDGTLFVDQQAKEGTLFADTKSKEGTLLVDSLKKEAEPLAQAFTLVAGTYTAPAYSPPAFTAPSITVPSFTAPSFTPGTLPQFADLTTPLTLPAGYPRLLELALAVELAPQYDVAPSDALLKNLADALARVRTFKAVMLPVEPQAAGVAAGG